MFEEPFSYPRKSDSLFGFGFTLEPWAIGNKMVTKTTYWQSIHAKTSKSLIESILG